MLPNAIVKQGRGGFYLNGKFHGIAYDTKGIQGIGITLKPIYIGYGDIDIEITTLTLLDTTGANKTPVDLEERADLLAYYVAKRELGAVDVNVQDQTTPVLISQLNRKLGETTLVAPVAIGDTQMVVSSAVGIINGLLIVITTIDGRTYVGKVTDILGAPTIILDTPINFAFQAATVVNFGTTEMNVNGTLAAPVIFSARGTGGDIPITFDITRIIFTAVTDTAVDLLKFGDLPILTNGLVLRRKDGIVSNIVNIKSNAAFANIAYDFTVYTKNNPAQGVDGFVCRLSFAGQNKMGVAIRLAPDEDLELLVQDPLGTLLELSSVIEGHVVE